MAEDRLFGLFREAPSVGNTIEQLRQIGVPDEAMTVMSGIPYTPETFGRPRRRGRLTVLTLAGALFGLVVALFLTVGIFLLYPLDQGGQPLVPIPPSLIIWFEVIMLGTMATAFFAFVVLNRFPVFGRVPYDPAITAGNIGMVVQVDSLLTPSADRILRRNGAWDVRLLDDSQRVNPRTWNIVMAAVIAVLAVTTIILLIFFYDVLAIPFPSQMVNQESIAYVQGPRLAAPTQAIPIQGPYLIAGQPASEPVPPTADSLQRGQIFFSINCVMCHDKNGTGNGPLAGYFSPPPFDLTGASVQSLPDDVLFLIITNGVGEMPSLAENLTAQDRWDVINHVHSLAR